MQQQQLHEQLTLQVAHHDQVLYGLNGPISSITLVANWTERSTAMLKAAVQRVVDANPFIAGALEERGGSLYVVARVHKTFMMEIEGPADFAPPAATIDAVASVQAILEQLFEPHCLGNMDAQRDSKSRLFQVILMRLPNDHVAYVVQLSHILGDGYSYYQLLKAINCAVNGEKMPSLTWKASPESVPLPSVWSEAEKDLLMKRWMSAYVENCNRWAPGSLDARKGSVHVIEPACVADLKAELKASCTANGVPFLSTNDLITAGLAELCDPKALLIMVANLRERVPEAANGVGGNFERCIHLPAEKATEPTFVRRLLRDSNWLYFGVDGNPRLDADGPKQAISSASLSAVTNWSNLTYMITPPNTRVCCHCPSAAFVTCVAGIDVSVIFKADKEDTLLVLCNHLVGTRGSQIAQRVRDSKIFRRLVKLPTREEGMHKLVGE
ncbi:hypothetical protein EMIHUDRAFT_195294 [Emiliania huxleyi CCMP1516]|uniref:Condensation domain-containing protein n=2 Tax=Emiliania huxleyi TaxID=2903 RepID=A0A0D3JH91_EMIH1|nr:hypothetical protein EMIHUDRAFT_195294 [Emiliania huxleyi CCMP1516]EOD22876.1 hypothetical protein EMIHUDRAFT_195294 [Emiliania huxleyi CCMP1516]|eukprot:XP_005775305.1 hypothetical protein EMIHUDRAFT_195294 [Emiliania huxleyi CCMP1516]